MAASRVRVLVLCTGNSARSQMLEAILRHHVGDRVDVESAGTRPVGAVHPLAIRALLEVGLDAPDGGPRNVNAIDLGGIDVVITVCDGARESCPVLPGAVRTIHVGYPDPAAATGSEEERLQAFRDVRDHMDGWARLGALIRDDVR